MFKLVLDNIKCYDHAEFLIHLNSMTLIKGKSGIGKSTILEAFTWCLYGKVKDIKKKNTEKSIYKVQLIFNNYKIIRQGNPKLLQYYILDKIYEDDVAQNIINENFGNIDLWYSCSYLMQGYKNPLITNSNHDRMKLLNNLCFWLDNPEVYINKIDDYIKQKNKELEISQKYYMEEFKRFQDDIKLKPYDINIYNLYITSKISKESLDEKITQIKSDIIELKIQLEKQKIIQGSINTISSNINRLNERLSNIKINSENIKKITNDRDNLRIKYKELQTKYEVLSFKLIDDAKIITENNSLKHVLEKKREAHISHLKYLNDMLSNLKIKSIKSKEDLINFENKLKPDILSWLKNNISNNLSDDISKFNKEYFEIHKTEELINKYQNICEKWNINYSNDSIENRIILLISQLNNIKKKKDILILKETLDTLEKQLQFYKSDKIVTDDDIILVQIELENLKKYATLIQCPHCNKSVRYISGKLHPENAEIVSQDNINTCKQKLDQLQEIRQKNIQYNQLQQKLLEKYAQFDILSQELIEFDINNFNESLLTSELSDLKNIQLPLLQNPIVSSSDILLKIEYSCLLQYYNSCNINDSKINQIEIDINNQNMDLININLELDQLSNSFIQNNNINLLKSEVNQLKIELSIIQNDIHYLDENINNYNILSVEIDTLQKQYNQLYIQIDHNIELEYNSKMLELNTYIHNHNQLLYILDILSKQNILKNKYNDISIISSDLTNLYEMKKLANELQCEQLQSTINKLNIIMNDILRDIFEDNIKVTLNMFRKSKIGDNLISNINFSIIYQDIEYDNLNSLSGGEKDRISLALTLALSTVNGSPFLFMDETMSSLDGQFREFCINTLKSKIGKNKTIICINHEDIEGNYDDILLLDHS